MSVPQNLLSSSAPPKNLLSFPSKINIPAPPKISPPFSLEKHHSPLSLKISLTAAPRTTSLQLAASTMPLITEDAPQDNSLQIPMPPVNLPLALQKHHMILHCPLKRRHVVEQGSSTWQNEQLHERPQMGVYTLTFIGSIDF